MGEAKSSNLESKSSKNASHVSPADLWPMAPKSIPRPANRIFEDVKMAPEVAFQEALSSKMSTEGATAAIEIQLASIRQANRKEPDAFLAGLLDRRDDLRGMPFQMGEACRTVGPRAMFLAALSTDLRRSVADSMKKGPKQLIDADKLWSTLAKSWKQAELAGTYRGAQIQQDEFESAAVAVMSQIVAPESAAVRLGLVEYLSRIPHVDATKAVARLALFAPEEDVSAAAIRDLKTRQEQDYLPILMEGFHYPLPQVAKRASEALVRLGCKDAVPQLVDFLEEPDPRLPVTMEVQGKKAAMVREVVRVNHHRNCILCHAPAEPIANDVEIDRLGFAPPILNAQVPLPNQPLPSVSLGYYSQRGPSSIRIRFDVTYLRQDFSLYMPVHDAAPWPDMQRFDFLVRNRVLSDQEAQEYQQQAPKVVAGGTTAYQRAVLYALRR